MFAQRTSPTREGAVVRRGELDFRIDARRDRLLGLWAAEKLGFAGADAERYAQEVVLADLEEPGDADVVRKIIRDFRIRRRSLCERDVRRAMVGLYETARRQVEGCG
ncbi:MAG: DUF1476 domain-containing protein [Alphaproteobacteria bacterium]